jgi:hypothetical protein
VDSEPFHVKKPFNLLNYHRTKDWIRMKNEYPNLHEIAMRVLCFSTTYLGETAFSAMTVLKTN